MLFSKDANEFCTLNLFNKYKKCLNLKFIDSLCMWAYSNVCKLMLLGTTYQHIAYINMTNIMWWMPDKDTELFFFLPLCHSGLGLCDIAASKVKFRVLRKVYLNYNLFTN